jgi:transcriptional regulator with XRE-family HTH domain
MIGARLRHLRLHHNLTQAAAADAIDASISKISRMEAGLTLFRREDLLGLLGLYKVTDPYRQEALLSVALGQRQPRWWDDPDVPLETTALWWGHEQDATLIRIFQPFMVPELLRTEEYARAAHHVHHYPSPPEAGDIACKNLLRRQNARTARLWAVIDEPVLWRPIGGDLDMHLRQLDALAAATRQPDIVIQIVPSDSPYLPGCGPFSIFRLPGAAQMLTLHRYTGDEIAELRAAEHHGLIFDQLVGVARRRSETPHLLAHIREHLQPQSSTRISPLGAPS